METVHTARFGRWAAVVQLNKQGTYTATFHRNGQKVFDTLDEAVSKSNEWVRAMHYKDLDSE